MSMSNPQLYRTTANTMKKIANLPRYRHPGDLINLQVRPINQQRMQINGQLKFGQKLYPSQLQQNLIKNLLPTRSSFRTSQIQSRNKMASQQYNLWRNYLDERVSKLPNSQLILDKRKQKVYQSFLIAKQRNQQKIQLARVVKLFYQISLAFKFDVRIHPLVMMRMVYPYYGYLNNYKNQRMSFDQFTKFLEQMVAVSQLFYQGSTLHGYQLLSFVFWKAYTINPSMNAEQFSSFLSLFKFNTKPQNLSNHLQYHLKNKVGEISESGPIRFDLWRNIFLERGL